MSSSSSIETSKRSEPLADAPQLAALARLLGQAAARAQADAAPGTAETTDTPTHMSDPMNSTNADAE